jgi:hypothetical protein
MVGTKSLIGLAVGIGGGAVAGLAGYGLYGTLRDKGYSPLKAGAATGAINGAIGGVALMILAAMYPDEDINTPAMAGFTVQKMGRTRGIAIAELPKAMGLVAAQQLSGIKAEVL